MASPGLLSTACLAAAVAPRPIVTAPAWHLGPALHMHAEAAGYEQAAEDRLLEEAGWEKDGYELFSIATPAASSGRGLFGPMGESSSLFLTRELWTELGGLEEGFTLPGGGLVNHDLYNRACALDGVELVVMLGEGTFHQIHGGAATSGHVTTRADVGGLRSHSGRFASTAVEPAALRRARPRRSTSRTSRCRWTEPPVTCPTTAREPWRARRSPWLEEEHRSRPPRWRRCGPGSRHGPDR